MKIPNSINIMGHNVKVKQKKYIDSKTKSQIGRAIYTENLILLSRHCHDCNVDSQYMACTLIHEILHHLDDRLTLGLKEVQVDRLAVGIYQVLKDNKLQF
jgi:hypothetical protein